MTEPADRAWDAAAQLVALTGEEVRLAHLADGVRLRFRAPSLAYESHLELLRILGESDSFGHERRSDGSGELWATYSGAGTPRAHRCGPPSRPGQLGSRVSRP
ncbi:hypothetical protein [Kitasatospora griseola]|uniref:hypothetical protein n=1 Tax=Kitasatospora griseola TaxID=2064 RepID=UPI00365D7E49